MNPPGVEAFCLGRTVSPCCPGMEKKMLNATWSKPSAGFHTMLQSASVTWRSIVVLPTSAMTLTTSP